MWSSIKISETVFNLQSGLVQGRNDHFQYLWSSFMMGGNSKHRLTGIMVVFCMSFYDALHLCEISWKYLKRFSTSEWTWVHGGKGYVQCSKGNNSKSRKTRVMVHVFCKLYYGVKFCENILNSIRVMEQTWVDGRNGYDQCSKGNNSVSRQTRVTVHVFCILSYSALH